MKSITYKQQEYIIKPMQDKPVRELLSFEEIPLSPDYKLKINGGTQMVYYNEFFSFAIFAVRQESVLNCELEVGFTFAEVKIRPAGAGVSCRREGNILYFNMQPMQKITLEFDGCLVTPVYILSNRYAKKPVDTTIHFERGKIYNVGNLELKTNDVVYIEEGSFVCGRIFSQMADNIRIVGNGILYGGVWHEWDENSMETTIQFTLGKGLLIEGVSIVDGGSWHVVPVASRDIVIWDVNIMGKVITGDGLDIVGCQNVLVKNCFIRANDDCISIKGCEYKDPSGCTNTKNVTIQNCVFWNAEYGNVLEIGYETRCEEICDITFKDCDIIHCQYEGNQSGGVFTIHNGDRAKVHHVYYENINVECAEEKLIDIKTLDSKYSLDRKRGEICNIYFKNINIIEGELPVSIIRGFEMHTEVCRPHDITFENIIFKGRKIQNANQLKMVVELSDQIQFC